MFTRVEHPADVTFNGRVGTVLGLALVWRAGVGAHCRPLINDGVEAGIAAIVFQCGRLGRSQSRRLYGHRLDTSQSHIVVLFVVSVMVVVVGKFVKVRFTVAGRWAR